MDAGEGQGTDFVDIEAGGFDQGQGETNVSKEAEPNNIVRRYLLSYSCHPPPLSISHHINT